MCPRRRRSVAFVAYQAQVGRYFSSPTLLRGLLCALGRRGRRAVRYALGLSGRSWRALRAPARHRRRVIGDRNASDPGLAHEVEVLAAWPPTEGEEARDDEARENGIRTQNSCLGRSGL
jgi:hypothetical protein